MKTLRTLVLLGVISGCSSAFGQSSRLLELFPYQPTVPTTFNQTISFEPVPLSLREMKPLDASALIVPKTSRLKVMIAPDIDVFPMPLIARGDILSGSLIEKYRKGFLVDLPWSGPTNMRIQSGFSWDMGKGTRLIFPMFSSGHLFKWTKDF